MSRSKTSKAQNRITDTAGGHTGCGDACLCNTDSPSVSTSTRNKNGSQNDRGGGELSRRDFLKSMGTGVAVVGLSAGCSRKDVNEGLEHLEGTNLVMVIDLQRCTGCGGCDLACKSENNLRDGHFWSHHITHTTGKFPNVRYEYLPTLCNQCANAPCEKACPTSALHKVNGGVTAHDPQKCIGCRACIINCPYGEVHAHFGEPHSEWKSEEELIQGVTGSPSSAVVDTSGTGTPYYNSERENHGEGNRYHGIVEKCDFCLHRLKENKLPACVKRCPTDARIFGDLNDPNSSVSRILSKYRPMRRMEHLGTEPKVFYVRSFNAAADYSQTKGELADQRDYDLIRRNADRATERSYDWKNGTITFSPEEELQNRNLARQFDSDEDGTIDHSKHAQQKQLFG